jgi:hypothetical protein
MVDVYVALKQLATGLDKEDLLKVIAAWYAEYEYGVEVEEDDLADVIDYIDINEDILLSIENTLANLDRQFGEEEDYEDDDYDEDYDEDYDDDDDDYDDENDDIDAETAHLMEINRRKNEEALGL